MNIWIKVVISVIIILDKPILYNSLVEISNLHIDVEAGIIRFIKLAGFYETKGSWSAIWDG